MFDLAQSEVIQSSHLTTVLSYQR
ncbi:hypothetical protein BUM88_00990 [Acinetobacter calcoaceticus]|nr:hypothetical protein BUM88_00990 [Acinetobacter calcoaceticus]